MIELTPMEKAWTWERMSGERLSDAHRKRILDGGDFVPPNQEESEGEIDESDDTIYGTVDERIHIEIDLLKDSIQGKWEYAVWRGETQLVLGWRDTLEEIALAIAKAIEP